MSVGTSPQIGVIEALIGSCPEMYGLDAGVWEGRQEFLVHSYDILEKVVNQKEKLSLREANEVCCVCL